MSGPPPALHERHPALRASLPHVRLGTPPTAVTRVPGLDARESEVWVKDEGAYGDGGWGGNKVRKLEWILPDVRRRGHRVVLTVGALGTNHGLATALYAPRCGLQAVVAVVDQPLDDHVRAQYERLLASGATVHRTRTPRRTMLLAPALLLRHAEGLRPPYLLPAGGSSPLGVLGAVECALELAAQVRAGQLPEPRSVVCAVGSGGTAAGLLLGLRVAGLQTTVHAVIVNDLMRLDERVVRRLAGRAARLLRRRGADVPAPSPRPGDLVVDRSALGPGYGQASPAAGAALLDAAEHGVALDPVYTAKALAGLRAAAGDGALGRGPVVLLRTHGPRG